MERVLRRNEGAEVQTLGQRTRADDRDWPVADAEKAFGDL